MANDVENGHRLGHASSAPRDVKPEAAMRDAEICQMAAFRIRETAKRVATLAARAESPLREQLAELGRRLQEEERALLEWATRSAAD